MKQAIKNLDNKIKSICQPNPAQYPDVSVQQLIWDRSIMNTYTNIAFLVLFPIFSFIYQFTAATNLVTMSISFLLLILFVGLCRSYLWVFNLVYVMIVIVFGYLTLDIVEETAYFHVGISFVLLVAMTMRTGDSKLAFLTGIGEAFIFMTKLKEKLISIIREEDTEVFADKFLKITLFCYFILLLVSISLMKALEQRTVELSSAKNALETALDQQKTFIFSFSHELRNPINSLLGNLQLVLQGEKLSAKAADMVNIAKVCGELLLHNINNVLDTGKHDIGKLEVNVVSTPLNELFQRAWSIYGELLRQKKLRSQLRIEKDLPKMVKIDAHKVNQIMLNLIGNAIKFTEKGSISVTVKWLKRREIDEKCFEPLPYDDVDEGLFEKEENLSTMSTNKFSTSDFSFLAGSEDLRQHNNESNSNEDSSPRDQEAKGVLKIIVKDTGSGMKKEAIEKLFKKFSQVCENISQRQIGTGLGLFITREICLAMNGEIRAYSRLGTGSTFVVCIPTTSVPLTRAQRANSESIVNQLTSRHIKALVADDSPFNVSLISNYFSKFGGSVVASAYNGYDAFRKYKECRGNIDVVTLDIDMPIMDGRLTCDNIRKYEKENGLKPVLILLISGNYDKEQIDEYLDPETGRRADYFLRKPVSFSEFNRTIYSLMS